MNHPRLTVLHPSVSLVVVAALVIGAQAAPRHATHRAAPAAQAGASRLAKADTAKPLPRFLPLNELLLWRKARGEQFTPPPRAVDNLDPVLPEMADQGMLHAMRLAQGPRRPKAAKATKKSAAAKKRAKRVSAPPVLPPLAPARIARPTVPKWVHYPLEFQLCGIALGTRAVNKDRFNRIDRYGLFAMHGNPTAVVVPVVSGGGGENGAGGPEAGAAGAGGPTAGGPGGAVAGAGGASGADGGNLSAAVTNVSVNQTPPLAATIFPSSQNGELPDWAAAITVHLDNNHVEWLYNRGTFAMGYLVDRLGFVDGIVCAGVESPIARTQLEDPLHTVKLGDDLRKVLFRYGYPDAVDTFPVNVTASAGRGASGAAGAGAGETAAGAGAAGAGAGAGQNGNGVFQTFEVRYEQSYNIVFTIRYNRVVRIYIFGDPDFFDAKRRDNLRTKY